MWCRDLTECLVAETPEEVLTNVKAAEQRCFEVRLAICYVIVQEVPVQAIDFNHD